MHRKMLVACDASEGSRIALVHAAILARKLGAELTALWVQASLPRYPEITEIAGEEQPSREFFEGIKQELQAVGAEHGVAIHAEMRLGNPAQQILAYAKEQAIDLIVIGSHGHSRLWGELLGHTADRVNEQAPCNVLIVRSEKEAAAYRRMLIGFDGSTGSEAALQHGLALAKQIASEVRVLWVQPVLPQGEGTDAVAYGEWASQFFNDELRPRVQAAAERAGLEAHVNFHLGNPAQTLVAEAAAAECRLVVIGSQGYSGLWNRLIGGVTDRVSHHAHCDVLIVREKETRE